MIADTSDIHAMSAAQHRHAGDLAAVAADLAAACVYPDAFGAVGARFLNALNAALTQQAQQVTLIADRMHIAGSTASRAADAYAAAEGAAGQSISIGGS